MDFDIDTSDAWSVRSSESDASDIPSAVLEGTPLVDGLSGEDELMPDEEFLQEDGTADSWLAQFPGGSRLLYPRLLFVESTGIDIVIPARNVREPQCFMTLPQELRSLIYRWYFDTSEEDDRHAGEQFNVFSERETHPPEEQYHAFPETHEDGLRRLNLTSEDTELKHLLSRPLLRACRQLRFEALPVLLGSRVFTVEWFPVIPRFIDFLGAKGCSMVRYLDMWDFHDMKSDLSYSDICTFLPILRSIQCLPLLRHLRIVLPHHDTFPHFERVDFERGIELTEETRPRIRAEDVRSQAREVLDLSSPSGPHDPNLWPEYLLLLGLSTNNFTLAFEFPNHIENYVEFDQTTGLYPELLRAMRGRRSQNANRNSTSPDLALDNQVAFYCAYITPHSGNTSMVDTESAAWQETDELADKTIPFYNFVVELATSAGLAYDETVIRHTKSTGAIMRDCDMCYCTGLHCGCHVIPPQLETDIKDDTDMPNFTYITAGVRALLDTVSETLATKEQYFRALVVQSYLGWPEQDRRVVDRLVELHNSVIDGTDMPMRDVHINIWNVLYREVLPLF